MLIENTNNYDVNIKIGKAQYHLNPKEIKDVKHYTSPSLPVGVHVVVVTLPKIKERVRKNDTKKYK